MVVRGGGVESVNAFASPKANTFPVWETSPKTHGHWQWVPCGLSDGAGRR